MKLEKIELKHRHHIERIRSKYGHQSSSHAFASLFLWQEELGLELYLTSDMFAARCKRRGENCWLFPCGAPEKIKEFLIHQLNTAKEPLRLCYMRTEDAEMLNRELPECFSLVAVPEDDEYLYDKEQQILLKGKEFRHQRNSLNRLKKKHELVTENITPGNLDKVALVFDKTRENRKENASALSTLSTERLVLENWDNLNMNGVIVYADGMPCAIAAGYMISVNTYDVSVCFQAIGDSDASVYARHQLFSRLPKEVTLINAEEDLGLEGLRILKQGMQPVGLLTMFEGVSR